MSLNRQPCQCEHISHFGPTLDHSPPSQAQGHKYRAEFHAPNMILKQTPLGRFLVCQECAKTCYHRYPDLVETQPQEPNQDA